MLSIVNFNIKTNLLYSLLSTKLGVFTMIFAQYTATLFFM